MRTMARALLTEIEAFLADIRPHGDQIRPGLGQRRPPGRQLAARQQRHAQDRRSRARLHAALARAGRGRGGAGDGTATAPARSRRGRAPAAGPGREAAVDKRIVLIIGGGIAAYKCLDLIRRLRERRVGVRAIMTKAAQAFITPLSVGALTGDHVFTDLFDLDEEREIGHIRLAREADLIVVAPATADLLAKMAGGHADDLASCVLLATDKPVLVAPAMNPRMWLNAATRRNVALLEADGIFFVGPAVGEMAEAGEAGPGRLAEVPELLAAIVDMLGSLAQRRRHAWPTQSLNPAGGRGARTRRQQTGPLAGRHVVVTSGPTHEPIDPVRYIANRSSGKQGMAIAAQARALGARVTLVSVRASRPSLPASISWRSRPRKRCLAAVSEGAALRYRQFSPRPSPTGAWHQDIFAEDQKGRTFRAAEAGARRRTPTS